MTIATKLAALSAAFVCAAASAQQAVDCGNPFVNSYGPFDYRTATAEQRNMVESYHFTTSVESLRSGSTGAVGSDLDYTLRCMGVDCVILAGASTDNCVLWTAADAFQLRYKVVVVEDCTMTHSEERTKAGAKEAALMIIRTVLHSEVAPLDTVIDKYLRPQ